MKTKSFIITATVVLVALTACQNTLHEQDIIISKETLMDKIKGGWIGKAIGCTYGGPTEFKYCGTMINDNIDIPWYVGYLKYTMLNCPGLYDDIYMDLTFVDVFEKKGLDADVTDFAQAFAYAEYPLCEANQQARYNIMHGIMPPASGHWLNNPHADDIDFQIEADYAGLMSPGMPNAASYYTDAIGHIMSYGDGWYGGVYIAAMYSLAFISDDIEFIVTEALKTIPEESKYYKCMSDVISWHKKYPDNWEITWALCQKYWSYDIGCVRAVRHEFDIDALINSAYVIIGLLYGQGDFEKTIDIATRCGQDSDCNPSTAGGILGTMLGYSSIPEKWMEGVSETEDIKFIYTDISLNDVYKMSFNQALQVISRNAGSVGDQNVTIHYTSPKAVRLEQSFANLWPSDVRIINLPIGSVGEISFHGKAIAIHHLMTSHDNDYVAQVEIVIDGVVYETVDLPSDNNKRRQEILYKYDLDEGDHTVLMRWINAKDIASIDITRAVIYN